MEDILESDLGIFIDKAIYKAREIPPEGIVNEVKRAMWCFGDLDNLEVKTLQEFANELCGGNSK